MNQRKKYEMVDTSRMIQHWRKGGMYHEMIFILGEIHLIRKSILENREMLERTGMSTKDRIPMTYEKVVGGYCKAVHKRKVQPVLWDMLVLKDMARWVLENPPEVSEEIIGDIKGKPLILYSVTYPQPIPDLKVHTLETVENYRPDGRLWQKAKF